VGSLLALFDRFGPPRRRELRVEVTTDSPGQLRAKFLAAFPGARVVELPNGASARKKVAFQVAVAEDVDAATVLSQLEAAEAVGVRMVRIEEEL
jgi:hypothetical protein